MVANRNNGAIERLLDHYKIDLLKLGAHYYRFHPYEYDMYNRPNWDSEKQQFIISEAVLALYDVCRSYDPDRSPFLAWMNFKLGKIYSGKAKKAHKKKKLLNAAVCVGDESSFTVGNDVPTKTKTIWREYSFVNAESSFAKAKASDIVADIFAATVNDSATKKALEELYGGFLQGETSIRAIAEKFGRSHNTHSAACRKFRANLPMKIRDKFAAFCDGSSTAYPRKTSN